MKKHIIEYIKLFEVETEKYREDFHKKLIKFLEIDLSIFPILNGLIFLIFKEIDFFIFLFSFCAFCIAIISKFILISFKMGRNIVHWKQFWLNAKLNQEKREYMDINYYHPKFDSIIDSIDQIENLVIILNTSILYGMISIIDTLLIMPFSYFSESINNLQIIYFILLFLPILFYLIKKIKIRHRIKCFQKEQAIKLKSQNNN